MINPAQKLNTKIFDKDVEEIPIRKGFGQGLLTAGKVDKNVVGICADLTESTQMHLFRDAFPERFIDIGVAEQNLATTASGMAAMGKIPFISSYAMFSPGRNWEQIRTTIAYNNVPVKIAGSHAGISVGPDGGTHQALEDMAIMRVMPRMVVISPADAIEAKKATEACAKTKDPTYIRLARDKTPIITTLDSPFEIGRAEVLFIPATGSADVLIVATGSVVHNALLAARELEKQKIGVTVLNVHTIKPLDEKTLLRSVGTAKFVVTVEEHQKMGGLGSAVCESLSSKRPIKVIRMGINDEFGQSGTPKELIAHYGLDSMAIFDTVKSELKK